MHCPRLSFVIIMGESKGPSAMRQSNFAPPRGADAAQAVQILCRAGVRPFATNDLIRRARNEKSHSGNGLAHERGDEG